ncbi:unnamed protein product [Symbiodinium pilosum]|uniref:Uncharacterized protein n=1 Tax=Symbiodinium pilosum TaxID=2952 RepID=A0A812S779_SYMPI|nr:unnamed protein product [Symbiodinium pilosum]
MVAAGLEEKALTLLDNYLKLHKPVDGYDSGDLLALWYALKWRKSGKKPKFVGKVALVLLKNSHMKVVVDDDGTMLDAGVASWDEETLKSVTVPDVIRDWRLFSDALCFLTDGEVGFEPIVVEDCWEVLTKAHNPLWDSKYQRCLSHTDFGAPDFVAALSKWEDGYAKDNGGQSDIVAFHLLFPAGRPPEAKVTITVGGIACSTVGHKAFKGRPAYQDEGLMWARHHRVFWLFHETHHLYEAEFQDRFDFAELIKKTDHPMFQYDNWMEEFKGGSEFFPGGHWHGENEFDWYVQSITKRLAPMSDPTLGEGWKSWWGGREAEENGAYYDFASEHQAMWNANVEEDWEKVCKLAGSQLRPMSFKRLGEHNFRNVVTVAVRGLTLNGKPLDGPVLEALREGMEVLEYPEDRASELIYGIPEEKKEELLKLYQGLEKPKGTSKPKLQKKKSKVISIIDDHHQMFDAFRTQDWEEVLEHVGTQVTKEAWQRLGDANFQNCFAMSFTALGFGQSSPKDVEEAVSLLRKGLEMTGWPLSTFEPQLANHPKKYEVLKPFAPADDAEGLYHDFITEHQAMWTANVQEDWETVCKLADSQLRPLSFKRLGEHNFRNVVTVAVRGLTLSGKPLDGPVVEALRKGMEVLGYPKERATELIYNIPDEKKAELLQLFQDM